MKAINPFSLSLLCVSLLLACLPVPSGAEEGQDEYSSFWKCSDGNTYGLVADGKKRALYLPTGAAPVFFSGVKNGNTYVGTVYVGSNPIPVSGPVTKNSTRVTLRANDGRTWVLDYSHK